MTSFVTLSCPNCGGKLQVTNNIDRFACAHCGKEHIVLRSGGTVSLQPVLDKIGEVKQSIDSLKGVTARGASASERTAAELALQRLAQQKKSIDIIGKIGMFMILMGLGIGFGYNNYLILIDGLFVGGGIVYIWWNTLRNITRQEIETRKIVNPM